MAGCCTSGTKEMNNVKLPNDGRINKEGPVPYLGMYSKGKMTGKMPGDVQMMHDAISGMLAADGNAMRMNSDNIVAKRAEMDAGMESELES